MRSNKRLISYIKFMSKNVDKSFQGDFFKIQICVFQNIYTNFFIDFKEVVSSRFQLAGW